MAVFQAMARHGALAILSVMVLVDNLNAIALRYGGMQTGPSQIAKTLMLACALLALRPPRLLWGAGILAFLLSFPLIHALQDGGREMGWFVYDVGIALKISTFPILLLFARQECEDGGGDRFRRILWFSFWLLAANLVASLFGFGFTQYDGGEGALGFFVGGNEVTGMQLVLSAFVLADLHARHPRWLVPMLIILTFLGAAKGTKSGALGVILLILYSYAATGWVRRLRPTHLLAGVIVAPLAAFAMGYAAWYAITTLHVVDRWIYFAFNSEPLGFLFSGRETRVIPFLIDFTTRWDWMLRLFGQGFPDGVTGGIYIELDSLDVLLANGIVGWIALHGLWGAVLVAALRKAALPAPEPRMLFGLLVLLAFTANTAGHIVYSAFALPFLAVFFAVAMQSAEPEPR